jgi:uncharacterized membrane protein AbrB (regulator of aidB expression)
MSALIVLVLLGIFAWLLGSMAGQGLYTQILAAEPGAIAVIMGIVGATITCHFLLYSSSTR